jgi:glutaredoxin-like protein NrdH
VPVIYSKPNCQQCNATKRQFEKQGIDYEIIDITEDHDARDYVLGLGYQQAPVVVVGDKHWSGYIPANIQALKM